MTKAATQIRPIRSAQDHRAAIGRIEEKMGSAPGTDAADELEVLAMLVDAYEALHYPMDTPDPVSVILFRMEQQQITRKEMEPILGSRARVSEVLSGKRSLTLAMVRRLKEKLGISADLLITPVTSRERKGSGHISPLPQAGSTRVKRVAVRA